MAGIPITMAASADATMAGILTTQWRGLGGAVDEGQHWYGEDYYQNCDTTASPWELNQTGRRERSTKAGEQYNRWGTVARLMEGYGLGQEDKDKGGTADGGYGLGQEDKEKGETSQQLDSFAQQDRARAAQERARAEDERKRAEGERTRAEEERAKAEEERKKAEEERRALETERCAAPREIAYAGAMSGTQIAYAGAMSGTQIAYSALRCPGGRLVCVCRCVWGAEGGCGSRVCPECYLPTDVDANCELCAALT
eukprot:1951704-Rhodomonas_salina.1